MDEPFIHLVGVSRRYGSVTALDGASLDVERGEVLALLGPSGCGKTTLLRLVAGFEEPDSGQIVIGGKVVASAEGPSVPAHARGVGMVFQDHALFPHLTVSANVGFGLARRDRAIRVPEILDLVGLADHGNRYPYQLSGGQQQRVALARAIAPRPSVILLDEPWSSSDPLLREAIRDELLALLRGLDVTVVLVTHDREEAFTTADRVALMREGRIVQVGRPEDVYYHPASRWAAEFVGAANFLPGQVAAGQVETTLGSFPVLRANGHEDVEVLVRPELLELVPDPAGSGEVVGREFRGHDVVYRVRLTDGRIVVSQRPSTELVALGARVVIRPYEHDVAVFSG